MFHSVVDAKRTPAVALVLLCSKMGLADRQLNIKQLTYYISYEIEIAGAQASSFIHGATAANLVAPSCSTYLL